ncbi:lipoprotein signal peptidase [Clostridia bacterium]|nr:lipoprotein signal peptidase [Clostridia bacterium]
MKNLLCAIGTAVIVVLDILMKQWVIAHVKGQNDVPLLPGIVHITYTENTGAAFGILQNARWIFVALGLIVFAAIIWTVFIKKMFGNNPVLLIAATLIFGGALGNWIDRAFSGYVVDMFELEFMRFGIFNVADAALTVGAITACVWLLVCYRDDKSKSK